MGEVFSERQPKLSIVTICYNEEKDIRKTCESVISQTFDDYEWIVIDGASQDRTLEIVKEYEENTSKIISEKDNGAYEAMNKGIKLAKGEYILFLNGGDFLIKPGVLENIFTDNKYAADILYGDVVFLYKNGHEEVSKFSKRISKRYFAQNFIGHQASFIKKSLFERYGAYDTRYKIVADWEKCMVFCKNRVKFQKIPFIVSVHKRFDGLSTAKDEKTWELHKKETDTILKEHYPLGRVKRNIDEVLREGDHRKFIGGAVGLKVAQKAKKCWEQFEKLFRKADRIGINKEGRNPRVIVSLTSFPERIPIIHKCLRSLLNQKFKPDELILWLGKEQFPNRDRNLPTEVMVLVKKGLTIKYCEDIKSYKKLIPSLKEYPNDIIVTADDDTRYPSNWLELLYKSYKKYPRCVHCHRANRIQFDENNELKSFLEWPSVINLGDQEPSFCNLISGCGGVLYPPGILFENALNQKLFMEMCPRADDIWFWAMAVLNDAKICVVENHIPEIDDLLPDKSKGTHLWVVNSAGGNDLQINNLFEYYPQLRNKVAVNCKKQSLG